MRQLIYKVTADRQHIDPSARRWAGMQGEDNATEIVFDLSVLNYKNALYRIDFHSTAVGSDPGSSVDSLGEDKTIRRSIPLSITQHGGEVQVTAVVTVLDSEGKETGIVLSYPVIVYFTEVKQQDGQKVAKSISAAEASALDAAERAEEAATYAMIYKDATETAAEETEKAWRNLEKDTTFVFLGGDANSSAETDLVVDKFLSEESSNPVANKAIASELNSINQALLERIAALEQFAPEEVGVKNGWNFKKYADGTYECWKNVDVQLTLENEWETAPNHYYSALDPINFPVTFADVPCLTITIENEFGDFLFTKKYTTTTNTGTLYAVSLKKYTEKQDITFCLSAKGRWKEVES